MSGIPLTSLGYGVDTNNYLIANNKNFTIDRRLVSIHSDDRNITKWPNSNHFEIQLPEAITNIQSMNLADITLPINYYTFSNEYQNTKLIFTVTTSPNTVPSHVSGLRESGYQPPKLESLTLSDMLYNDKVLDGSYEFEITIDEGYYAPSQLASEIASRMNAAVQKYLRTTAKPVNTNKYTYNNFNITYNVVSQKFMFGNLVDSFELKFAYKIPYVTKCPQINVWEKNTNWGLPSYLGFDRANYSSQMYQTDNGTGIPIYWSTSAQNWLTSKPLTSGPAAGIAASTQVYYLIAPFTADIFGERAIYMEVEKYNNYTELEPYSIKQNDFCGKTNSAFAKIPITKNPNTAEYENRNSHLQNIINFNPPLERISKLKFTFRYHDGRLVDFQNNLFNFTIGFNCLTNEIPNQYNIRVPPSFTP